MLCPYLFSGLVSSEEFSELQRVSVPVNKDIFMVDFIYKRLSASILPDLEMIKIVILYAMFTFPFGVILIRQGFSFKF